MFKNDLLRDSKSPLNQASNDEPLFVLRGSNPAAPQVLVELIKESMRLGQTQDADEMIETAQAMVDFQKKQAKDANQKYGGNRSVGPTCPDCGLRMIVSQNSQYGTWFAWCRRFPDLIDECKKSFDWSDEKQMWIGPRLKRPRY